MINGMYDNHKFEEVLYKDFKRRKVSQEMIKEIRNEKLKESAKKKKANKNSEFYAQNRVKKVVD